LESWATDGEFDSGLLAERPYYFVEGPYARCLELGGDGSYRTAQLFLGMLKKQFEARIWVEIESGERPGVDKEKGYWSIEIRGERLFFMRSRGDGMCLWGPKPPGSLDVFLRIARFVGAEQGFANQPLSHRLLAMAGNVFSRFKNVIKGLRSENESTN
jgi:hypothetical protein